MLMNLGRLRDTRPDMRVLLLGLKENEGDMELNRLILPAREDNLVFDLLLLMPMPRGFNQLLGE